MAKKYELIAQANVTSNQAEIAFTSIPATYTDLFITLSARSDRAATNAVMYMQFNNDGNHEHQRLLGGGGGNAGVVASRTSEAGVTNGTSNTSNSFSSHQYYIPNYAGSAKKLFIAETAQAHNSNSINVYTLLLAGQNSSITAALTSVKFYIEESKNFVNHSTATLYGIKNS
jgi:hypothetical protein